MFSQQTERQTVIYRLALLYDLIPVFRKTGTFFEQLEKTSFKQQDHPFGKPGHL